MYAILLVLGCSNLFAGTIGVSAGSTYDFNGLYAGLGTGFTSLFTTDSFNTTRSNVSTLAGDTNRYTETAVLFTGNLGYGAMIDQKIYFGAKGSIYYTPLETLNETGFTTPEGTVLTVGNNSITSLVKPFYNIDAVLGYEFLPHFLPFVEAGVTFANANRNYIFKRTRTDVVSGSNVSYKSTVNLDNYETGYNVGIGFNYQVKKHWIFSTELVFNDLGKNAGAATVGIPGTAITEMQSRKMSTNAMALFASVSYLV